MRLFWLKTQFTWIASLSEFDNVRHARVIRYVKPEVGKLCNHLLGIDGKRVVVPFYEAPGLLEALAEIGQITSYEKLHVKSGEERECHSNSASLWLSNKKKYKIVTGFGLSNDNIWRRHSWIMTVDGDLIETTIARAVYFGILLNSKIAKTFSEFYR